jgi:GNAT superfamily N-acetyltransferase
MIESNSIGVRHPPPQNQRLHSQVVVGVYLLTSKRTENQNLMITIRNATIGDVGLLKNLICELADYERERDQVVVTEEELARDGFSPAPKFRAVIAEWNGQAAGYALFFAYYSTWVGRPGLFLEDLFVREAFRGKQIGKALLAHVAHIARQENCYGMRWEVLDWNQPAIEFYQSLGATFLDQWKSVLLTGQALAKVSSKSGT